MKHSNQVNYFTLSKLTSYQQSLFCLLLAEEMRPYLMFECMLTDQKERAKKFNLALRYMFDLHDEVKTTKEYELKDEQREELKKHVEALDVKKGELGPELATFFNAIIFASKVLELSITALLNPTGEEAPLASDISETLSINLAHFDARDIRLKKIKDRQLSDDYKIAEELQIMALEACTDDDISLEVYRTIYRDVTYRSNDLDFPEMNDVDKYIVSLTAQEA